jgi:hypothetical protein
LLYTDVCIEKGKSFLESCWLKEFDERWGGGSFNSNRWMEETSRTRLSEEATRILEPIAGEKNFISTPERLRELTQKIGEEKVIKTIYDIRKNR